MSEVKRIDIKEFRAQGYLQEVNRRFLHPLGLALEVIIDDDGSEKLGGVWDYRDDPEGMAYGEGIIDPEKAARVASEMSNRRGSRIGSLGYWIQPLSLPTEDSDAG